MRESLFHFAIPERLSGQVLERIVPIAGGATVLPAVLHLFVERLKA